MTEAEVQARRHQFLAGMKLGFNHGLQKQGHHCPIDATERFVQGYEYGHEQYELEAAANRTRLTPVVLVFE